MSNLSKTPKILIIAGSDPSGGAGIQADIKTATANKTYSSCVITCLTAQNTKKVADIFYPPIEFLQKQLETVLEDIKFDAIKIGMLADQKIINCVAKILSTKAKDTKIIFDPVMVATSGDLLIEENALNSLKNFTKNAFLITPNIDEAEILSSMKINNVEDMKKSAIYLKNLGAKNILIKGGHLKQENDKIFNILLDETNKISIIENIKLNIGDIHGTGCTLSSAIACNIAQNKNIVDATKEANEYVFKSLEKSIKIGQGSKVLQHY